MKKIPQDIIGTIAILKFPKKTWWITKKIKAKNFLRTHTQITTVVEKIEGFTGTLRTQKTKHLAGKKTKETLYKENNCLFKVHLDETYFSPRLSNERKLLAEEILQQTKRKKHPRILIMFAGIGPFPIVIAKKLKQTKKQATIISSELNKKATELTKENIKLNKVERYITVIQGDSKNLTRKKLEPFDTILMARPNLQETFLQTTLQLTKKGTTIHYHGFGTKEKVLEEIKKETKNKIGKITIRKAGDIKAYEYRWLATFKVK
jgi:tRNA (guanine37-N1)-methyltransferase